MGEKLSLIFFYLLAAPVTPTKPVPGRGVVSGTGATEGPEEIAPTASISAPA
jgi:hypothetical protein